MFEDLTWKKTLLISAGIIVLGVALFSVWIVSGGAQVNIAAKTEWVNDNLTCIKDGRVMGDVEPYYNSGVWDARITDNNSDWENDYDLHFATEEEAKDALEKWVDRREICSN